MRTIYLDMDGVVADFDEYANRTLGLPPSEGVYPEDVWIQLASNGRIYRDLVLCKDANLLVDTMIEIALANKIDIKFLSAVPKGNDVPWAFTDKVEWAHKYFSGIPVMFGPFSKDKHVHCKPGDILIDDRLSNIEEWNAAGGHGILYRGDAQDAISKVKLVL
jgi:5'(3')-deoxyribonucleotidase